MCQDQQLVVTLGNYLIVFRLLAPDQKRSLEGVRWSKEKHNRVNSRGVNKSLSLKVQVVGDNTHKCPKAHFIRYFTNEFIPKNVLLLRRPLADVDRVPLKRNNRTVYHCLQDDDCALFFVARSVLRFATTILFWREEQTLRSIPWSRRTQHSKYRQSSIVLFQTL